MRNAFVLTCLSLLMTSVTGCGVNHYLRVDSAPPGVDLSQSGGDKSVVLLVGSTDTPNTSRVVDSESYIIGPGKRRYGVMSRPFAPDLDPLYRAINKRQEILLLTQSGKPRNRDLENGTWKFYLTVDSPTGRRELKVFGERYSRFDPGLLGFFAMSTGYKG